MPVGLYLLPSIVTTSIRSHLQSPRKEFEGLDEASSSSSSAACHQSWTQSVPFGSIKTSGAANINLTSVVRSNAESSQTLDSLERFSVWKSRTGSIPKQIQSGRHSLALELFLHGRQASGVTVFRETLSTVPIRRYRQADGVLVRAVESKLQKRAPITYGYIGPAIQQNEKTL